MVERLFLAVPQGCLRFVIVVFPDHTHFLSLNRYDSYGLMLVFRGSKAPVGLSQNFMRDMSVK